MINPLSAQVDAAALDTATKLFGPLGAVLLGLVGALVYVFKRYERTQEARIEDAKRGAELIEKLLPYLARIARRVERGRAADSEPPPISRARIEADEGDER